MKLIINKFPPITQPCEIDLSKKVILFVGKNNSGKTYLSQLIWGIFNFDDKDYFKQNIKPTQFINDENRNDKSIQLTQTHLNSVASNFVQYFREKKIENIFKQKMDVDFSLSLNLNKSGIVKVIVFNLGKIEIIKQDGNWFLFCNSTEDDIEKLNYFIESTILKMFFQKKQQVTYLPSTRLFLPSFYKYIVRLEKEIKDELLLKLDKINQNNKHFFASSYTQPFDFLIANLIFNINYSVEKNKYLSILSNIIEGEISVDKAEEISMVDISYKHKSGTNIPMYLSSSMVNQLSMLYLYFKYWYDEKNNFLLLDEPEMNLHPSKKIEVMELLLDFASENKLLIATHSSTLAKSLINYLHLFDLKDKKENMQEFIDENELDMNLNIDLKSNDIGIYAFNGKTIVSYKRDNDSDIHFGTFTEVEELQNKQFEYIMEELDKYDS